MDKVQTRWNCGLLVQERFIVKTERESSASPSGSARKVPRLRWNAQVCKAKSSAVVRTQAPRSCLGLFVSMELIKTPRDQDLNLETAGFLHYLSQSQHGPQQKVSSERRRNLGSLDNLWSYFVDPQGAWSSDVESTGTRQRVQHTTKALSWLAFKVSCIQGEAIFFELLGSNRFKFLGTGHGFGLDRSLRKGKFTTISNEAKAGEMGKNRRFKFHR